MVQFALSLQDFYRLVLEAACLLHAKVTTASLSTAFSGAGLAIGFC